MGQHVSEAQWATFEAQGYLHLGNVMEDGQLEA